LAGKMDWGVRGREGGGGGKNEGRERETGRQSITNCYIDKKKEEKEKKDGERGREREREREKKKGEGGKKRKNLISNIFPLHHHKDKNSISTGGSIYSK